MIKRVRDKLRQARERLWELVRKRHEANVGGKRRKKLAREVRHQRGDKDAFAKKLKFLIEQRDAHVPNVDGIVQFDGVPCAAWIARDLQKIRDLGWGGFLISGFRSPEHCEQLCLAMCGAITCPGRCAGRSSEHCFYVEPRGACDLDPAHELQAESLFRKIGSPLHNALGAADPNHNSASGH
jgi:hypothetical protein